MSCTDDTGVILELVSDHADAAYTVGRYEYQVFRDGPLSREEFVLFEHARRKQWEKSAQIRSALIALIQKELDQ